MGLAVDKTKVQLIEIAKLNLDQIDQRVHLGSLKTLLSDFRTTGPSVTSSQ
jgi:hypothetical protein